MPHNKMLCLALLAAALSPLSARAQPEEISGAQVLERSAQAYQKLRFYSGTTAVISTAQIGEMKLGQTASAQIQFSRADGLRIEGLDTKGGQFSIVSDFNKTWRSIAFKNQGAPEEAQSIELAVAAMTGVAAGAPTAVPAALLQLNWGNPFRAAQKAGVKIEGTEVVDGAECLKVVAETPISRLTFWVDSQSFLLRQSKEEQGEAHLTAMLKDVPKGDSAGAPEVAQIKSRMVLSMFLIASTDKPLDAALFQLPARQPIKPD